MRERLFRSDRIKQSKSGTLEPPDHPQGQNGGEGWIQTKVGAVFRGKKMPAFAGIASTTDEQEARTVSRESPCPSSLSSRI